MGIPPKLSDAELVTLAVMQALLGFCSEARWLRYASRHLRPLFPYLPGQSGYNKRLRAAAGLIRQVIRAIASDTMLWTDDVWLVDSTPVECGRSRETTRRSALAGWAAYGWCASHSRWFWGLRLHLVCTLHGLPVAFALADAKAVDREVLAELLAVEPELVALRPGQVLVADKNYYGREFEAGLAELGVRLVRPARRGEPERPGGGLFKPLRQLVESVNQTLKGQLDLERHGGRTPDGVWVRVLQRILALTVAIWHNHHTGQPTLRSLLAYDHCDDPGGGRGVGLTRDSGGFVPGFRPVDPRSGRHAGRRAVAVTGLTLGSTGLLPARRSVGPRLWPRDDSAVATRA